jgi:hypothetical protein
MEEVIRAGRLFNLNPKTSRHKRRGVFFYSLHNQRLNRARPNLKMPRRLNAKPRLSARRIIIRPAQRPIAILTGDHTLHRHPRHVDSLKQMSFQFLVRCFTRDERVSVAAFNYPAFRAEFIKLKSMTSYERVLYRAEKARRTHRQRRATLVQADAGVYFEAGRWRVGQGRMVPGAERPEPAQRYPGAEAGTIDAAKVAERMGRNWWLFSIAYWKAGRTRHACPTPFADPLRGIVTYDPEILAYQRIRRICRKIATRRADAMTDVEFRRMARAVLNEENPVKRVKRVPAL